MCCFCLLYIRLSCPLSSTSACSPSLYNGREQFTGSAVQTTESYSHRLFIPTHIPAAPGSSQANTQTLPTHLTYITSTMPTSSRFTEHIDTATTRQSTSPECDVRLDDILKMSISQTHTQKARAWSGSSSNSSASSREEQPAMQQEKKSKRGSRFLGRKV